MKSGRKDVESGTFCPPTPLLIGFVSTTASLPLEDLAARPRVDGLELESIVWKKAKSPSVSTGVLTAIC
jgi:hypothetical protein